MINEYSRLINALETALATVTAERDALKKENHALRSTSTEVPLWDSTTLDAVRTLQIVAAERDELRKQVAQMDEDIRKERAVAERLIHEKVKRENMFERGEQASGPSGTFYPAMVELPQVPNAPLHSHSEFMELKTQLERAVQSLDKAHADKGQLAEAILTTLQPESYRKVFELYHALRGTYYPDAEIPRE